MAQPFSLCGPDMAAARREYIWRDATLVAWLAQPNQQLLFNGHRVKATVVRDAYWDYCRQRPSPPSEKSFACQFRHRFDRRWWTDRGVQRQGHWLTFPGDGLHAVVTSAWYQNRLRQLDAQLRQLQRQAAALAQHAPIVPFIPAAPLPPAAVVHAVPAVVNPFMIAAPAAGRV